MPLPKSSCHQGQGPVVTTGATIASPTTTLSTADG
jgi:hypothetical protein